MGYWKKTYYYYTARVDADTFVDGYNEPGCVTTPAGSLSYYKLKWGYGNGGGYYEKIQYAYAYLRFDLASYMLHPETERVDYDYGGALSLWYLPETDERLDGENECELYGMETHNWNEDGLTNANDGLVNGYWEGYDYTFTLNFDRSIDGNPQPEKHSFILDHTLMYRAHTGSLRLYNFWMAGKKVWPDPIIPSVYVASRHYHDMNCHPTLTFRTYTQEWIPDQVYYNYYVDSATGLDGSTGRYPYTPWKSMDHSARMVTPITTLHIKNDYVNEPAKNRIAPTPDSVKWVLWDTSSAFIEVNGELALTADTYVRYLEGNRNFGSSSQISIGSEYVNIRTPYRHVVAYLQFETTGYTLPVKKAVLRLYHESSGWWEHFWITRTTEPFFEQEMTWWAGRPAYTDAYSVEVGLSYAPVGWHEWDVTAMVNQSSNGYVGFRLSREGQDYAADSIAVFSSKEGNHPPQLVITP